MVRKFNPSTSVLCLVSLLLLSQLSLAASERVLKSFSSLTGGAFPFGTVFERNGAFYGTTQVGGSGGQGTVFRLAPSSGGWTETVLHSFSGIDGQFPTGNLAMDAAGNIYGTTTNGGAASTGTVYELTPNADGSYSETTLYTFSGSTDGWLPQGGVILDHNGNLLGTTIRGGQMGLCSGSDAAWCFS